MSNQHSKQFAGLMFLSGIFSWGAAALYFKAAAIKREAAALMGEVETTNPIFGRGSFLVLAGTVALIAGINRLRNPIPKAKATDPRLFAGTILTMLAVAGFFLLLSLGMTAAFLGLAPD